METYVSAEETQTRIQRVAQAAAGGKLRIMVGAGVSMGDPMETPDRRVGLEQMPPVPRLGKIVGERPPGFKGLAERVYEQEWKAWKAKHKDGDVRVFFDEMLDKHGDEVLYKVKAELEKYEEPSYLHHLVLDLIGPAHERVVVTTNYDTLLERAAEVREMRGVGTWDPERMEAGDGPDARGAVHPHGVVSHPKGIVVSVSQMEALWSNESKRRFLRAALGRGEGSVVLFVGYGHGDKAVGGVLKRMERDYLEALKELPKGGRPSVPEVYSIMADEPQDELGKTEADWGLKVIPYKRGIRGSKGEHKDAEETLKKIIAEEQRMSARAKRDRLQSLGRKGAGEASDSELQEANEILKHNGVDQQNLLKEAHPKDWTSQRALSKAGMRAFFRTEDRTSSTDVFYHWLCTNMDGERLQAIRDMVEGSEGWLPRDLRHVMGVYLGDRDTNLTPDERQAWGMYLLGQAREQGVNDMDVVMLTSIAQRGIEDNLHQVGLETLKTVTDLSSEEALKRVFERNTLTVHMFWTDAIKPIVAEHRDTVWNACTDALRREHEYEKETSAKSARETGISRWGFRRSAVEDHEQDEIGADSFMGMVIEGCRTVLEQEGRESGGERSAWERKVKECWAEEAPLLRRLALHAVAETDLWTDSKKVGWLAESKALNFAGYKHEAYRLLRRTWPGADDEAREKISRAILGVKHQINKQDPEMEVEYHDRVRFELIHWIGAEQTHPLLKAELDRIEALHPRWERADHPDFLHWMSGGHWVGPSAPPGWEKEKLLDRRTPEDLRDIVELDYAVEWRTMKEWQDRPNRQGEEMALKTAIKEDLGWGRLLAESLAKAEKWNHPGWSALAEIIAERQNEDMAADLFENPWWEEVLAEGNGWTVGEMVGQAARHAHKEEWPTETVHRLRKRTLGLLEALTRSDMDKETLGWMGWSINTQGGKGVEAAITLLSRENTEEAWNETLEALRNLWRQGGNGKRHVAIHTASNIAWIESRQKGWTREIVNEELARAGEEGEFRSVIWGGLAYSNWQYGMLVGLLKEDFDRELEYQEPASREVGLEGEDPPAEGFATLGMGNVLFGGGDWRKDWSIAKVSIKRRQRVVERVCWHTKREEETREAGAWGKAVKPLWKEILELGGPTRKEQETFLGCLTELDEQAAEELSQLFRQGPQISPGRFDFSEEEMDKLQNRDAAVAVFDHCAPTYRSNPTEDWAWQGIIRALRKWRDEAGTEDRKEKIEELLAKLKPE